MEDKYHLAVPVTNPPQEEEGGGGEGLPGAGQLYELALSVEERKVLISLAVSESAQSLADLCFSTGLDGAQVEQTLARLEAQGLVKEVPSCAAAEPAAAQKGILTEPIFPLPGAPDPTAPAQPEQPSRTEEVPPPVLLEHPPAPPQTEAERLDYESLKNYLDSLPRMNYYQMLGVSPHAERREIRRAYYALVARFHPDQHHQVSDPRLCELLAEIFSTLTQAYETLHSTKRRRLYDRTIPEVTGVQESEEEEALAALFEETKERPAKDTAAPEEPSGWGFYQTALEQFQAGNYHEAEINFKLALGMEPGRKEYQEGLEKTKKILTAQLVQQFRAEGERLEKERQFHGALAAFLRAVELDPYNADLRYALARIRFLSTIDRLRAEEDVSWAVALDPRHVEALLLMGRIQAWKGDTEAAVKTFKQVLAIVPGHPKAKQALELFEKK